MSKPEQPKRGRGRPRGSTNVKPNVDLVQTHEGLLAELRELSPVSQEPVYNAQRRFSPAAFEATRTKMLTELLEEEGPGDNLVAHLRARPADFTPAFLEGYKQSRHVFAEIIAQRTKADVQADVEHLTQTIVDNEKYCPTATVFIGNLKKALERTKRELEGFDGDPVRLHAVARHLKYRYHSYVTEEECPVCASAAAAAADQKTPSANASERAGELQRSEGPDQRASGDLK